MNSSLIPDLLEFLTVHSWQILLAMGSVVIAEILRDCYHIAGHYWRPLQPWHNLHHKAYRSDLSKVSMEIYRQAELFNDVPEATFMVLATGAIAWLSSISYDYGWVMAFGCLYSLGFLVTGLARSQGLLLETDLTHKPGDLVELPSQWGVNRTYHWRHHFDRGEAYFCSTFTFVDKVLGTALALKGKSIAITGASGTMGRALVSELTKRGARVIALTTSPDASFDIAGGENKKVEVLTWQLDHEFELRDRLQKVDILILNHGVNALGARDSQSVYKSYEVNTFSVLRWMDLFLETVTESKHIATKEIWINTSEAEVNPALSPLYELSKRAIGDLVTLRRLDAPCTIRKLILGPFKSNLNPYGVMSASFVAWAIAALAQRDFRDIIVTINPLTFILYPLKEFWKSLYFRIFSRRNSS
jgi:sterol desaturase/sphingolipid hydroxylase (fatty acid hydroxylase superfamily)